MGRERRRGENSGASREGNSHRRHDDEDGIRAVHNWSEEGALEKSERPRQMKVELGRGRAGGPRRMLGPPGPVWEA